MVSPAQLRPWAQPQMEHSSLDRQSHQALTAATQASNGAWQAGLRQLRLWVEIPLLGTTGCRELPLLYHPNLRPSAPRTRLRAQKSPPIFRLDLFPSYLKQTPSAVYV